MKFLKTGKKYYRTYECKFTVIGAKQVIPLDSNGLSDPFVVIELVPRIKFSNSPTFKTRIINKTLSPTFDETFEL